MKFFTDTRTKRITAFALLLVWLFALASGVAHACLLEAPETHSHATRAGHDETAATAMESCVPASDDGAQSVRNASAGLDQTDPGPAFLVATLWTASAHVVSAARRLDDLRPPAVGPPLRIRYSRLAL